MSITKEKFEELAHTEVMPFVWPKTHPATGKPLVRLLHAEIKHSTLAVDYMPPVPPQRQVAEYCDILDDYVVRERTEEEYQEALANYKREKELYATTYGRMYLPGQTSTKATFADEDGSDCTGYYAERPKEWFWQEYHIAVAT